MSEQTTFSGSREELLKSMIGEDAAENLGEDASFKVMDFLRDHGASFSLNGKPSESLEVHLGGSFFLSVRRFIWTSVSAILSLAVAIVANDPKGLAPAAQLVANLLSNISIFPADSTEFKAYSAVAGVQKENPGRSPRVGQILPWLSDAGEDVSEEELLRALGVLVDRHLLRRAGEDLFQIVW